MYETLTHTPDRASNRTWGDYDMFNEVLDGDEERRRVAYDRMRRYGGYEGSWDDFNGELGLAASSPGGDAAAGGRGASMVVPSHAPEVSYGTAVPGVTSATGGEEASVTAKRPKETTADLLVRRDKAQERFMKSSKGEALQRRMDDAYYNKLSEYLPGYLSSGQGKEFVSKAKASGMSKEQIIQAVMDEVNYLHAPEFDEMWEAGGYNEKIAAGVEASDPGLSEAMARQGNKVDVLALTDKIGREREALRQWRQEHPEAYHRGNGMSYYNTRMAQLDAAEAQMDEARRIIEEAGRDSRKGGGRRLAALGRGIRDVVTDLDTWTMGFADVKNGEPLVRTLEKSDRGETLTDSEELLLDAVLTNAAARDLNAGRISGWYDAGQVTGEMLPFVVQIAASGGLTSALSEGMSAATRGLVKHGLRKMGQTAAGRAAINSGLRAGRAVSRFGQRLGTNRYGQWLAKGAEALGGGLKALPGTMAKGAVVAGSTGLPRTVADYYGREADSYEFGRGDDGRYDVERTGASPGENARRAFYSNAAEFGSEFAGGALGKVVGGMADIARAVPGAGDILGLGAQLTNKLRHTRAGRLYDAVVNAPVAGALRRATNIGGLSEEYLEEVYNNVLAGLSGDMDWSDVTSLDQNVETFMALVPAQVAFGMLGLGGMAAGLRSCNKARREMRDDADEALLPIMDGIDLADNEHIERIIKDVARSGSMGMEDKSAILRYANNTLRGRELTGSRGRSRAEDSMGDAAYQRGYGMTDGGQMDAALTEVAVLGDELAGTFSSEELYQMQAMSPSSVSRWLSERGRGEQIPAAMEYMEAAATVSGIRAGIEDRASSKAEEAERLVRENANLGTGTVVAVTLRDGRKAFVKSGEAMSRSRGEYDGGGVRRAELASNSLVVRDAATGETRMVPDGDIVRVDSEEALETAVAEARKVAYDGAIAEGGRLLRGDVDMGVGTSFDVAFDDGSYGRVKVTADNGDGTVDVQMSDGSEVKGMAKEVLQVLARNYRLSKRRDERRASGSAYGMNGSAGAGSGNAPAGSDAGVRVGDMVEMDGRRGEVAEVRDDGAVVSWDDGRVTLESLEAAARGKVDDGADVPAGGSVSVNAAEVVAAAQGLSAQTGDVSSGEDSVSGGGMQVSGGVPTDKDGNVAYDLMDALDAVSDIYNNQGLTAEEADSFVEANMKQSQRDVKSIEGKAPRMGTNLARYKSAKEAWQGRLDEARRKAEFWNEVADVRRLMSQEPGEREAAEMMSMTEPQDLHEYAALFLMGQKLLRESYMKELGYGNAEARKMFGQFASKEKGGVSIERASELLSELGEYPYATPENQDDVRNAIIDVLSEVETRGDLFRYISRRRQAMAEELVRAEREHLDDEYMREYGMGVAEYEAYVERLEEEIRSMPPEAVDEINAIIADEIDAYYKSKENANGEENIDAVTVGGAAHDDAGGGTVLQGAWSADGGRTASAGGEVVSEGAGEVGAAQQAARQDSEGREGDIVGKPVGERLTRAEALAIIASMEERAKAAPELELTIENWDAEFGEDGRVDTPLGEVKMGENQFTKLMRQGRNGKLGMIRPTLENPDIIVEDSSEAKDGDATERASSYVYVKTFIKPDGSRYYYFTSVTVSKDGHEVVVSNQEKRRNVLTNLLLKGKLVWKHADDVSTASDVADGLYSSQGNMSDPATEGTDAPQTNNSVHKHTDKSPVAQTVGEKVAAAEAETATDPTEGQKEAGNYRKGHVRIGQFDITVENPKGSVRRGVDASGKAWEQTMQNTYGYIRGTEGVDGDHIDVFLTDDIDGWDGRRVYVVDQYNEDGTFDEHKVMLGFNDEAAAWDAYLSNYEKGWEEKRKLVMSSANLEDFGKWIGSSRRKTKPFAEYKGVKKDTPQPDIFTGAYNSTYTALTAALKGNIPNVKAIQAKIRDYKKRIKTLQDGASTGVSSDEQLRQTEAGIERLRGEQKAYEDVLQSINDRMVATEAEQSGGYAIEPAQYTTKRGRVLDMFLVKFTEQLGKEQQRAAREIAKAEKGWYDRDKGGFMMRSEESARRLADTVTGDEEAVSDAQPLSLADIRGAVPPVVRQVDVEGLAQALRRDGVARLSDHSASLPGQDGVAGTETSGVLPAPEDGRTARIEKLRRSEPLVVSGNDYQGKYELDPKSATRYVLDELRGEYVNRDTGETIRISRKGAEKVMKHDVENDAHLKSAAYIPQMIENSIFITEETNTKGKTGFDSYRYYVVGLRMGGVDYTAKLVIGKKNGESYYDHSLTEIEKNSLLESIDPINTGFADKEAAVSGIKDKRLLSILQADGRDNSYGAGNKLVSRERYDELRERMRRKLGGQMNMGIDPEILAIGTEMAAYHIEAGARKFADYAARMIADLGDAIRPYLKAFYNGARDLPEVVESGLSDGMTPWDEVRVFDVANFDKESTDAMAAAETIAREQEVEGEADEAKGKLAVRRNGQRRKAISSRRQDAGQSGGLFEGDARLDGGLNRRFAMAVKDDMLAALAGGTKPYRGILDLRKRASGLGMEVDNDGRTDILLQELVEDGLVRAAREVAERHGSDSRETYDLVCKLYGMQPTIAARSSNRIKMQQYSTPLPMAWNAARFAMSGKRGGKVLEPTAGNGMLVFAIPAWQVHANELDGTRLANLREQGFAQVTQQDATEPFEGGRQYDVVIANPPFGKREEVEYDGKMIPGLDPQITLNALASMKDDGKAAIIIGGNMEYGNNGGLKSMKPFFTYLYDHYNVKGVVDMDGSLYAKQGTTYPTRMILIDGRRSDEERARSAVYPPVQSKAIRKADSFEALYDIVDELTNSKNKTNGTEILRERKPLRPVADRPRGDADQGGREGQPAESNQPVERVRGGLDSRPEDVLGEQGGDDTRDGRGSAGGRGSDRELGGHPDQRVGREGRPSPVPAQQGGSGRPAGASGRGGGRVRGGREGLLDAQLHPDGGTGDGSRPVLKEGSQRQLDTEKLPYRPHNSAFSLESVAPAAMVEAMDRTLSRIEREHGDIDEFVRKELGYGTVDELHQALAAEQVDSVAMAIYQMKQGQALIIGDQTGVGKGRQMAALIRWAVRQGEKPIFITQKADLFSDIYRDLVDIGSGDLVPFIFNDPSGNENRGEMVDANGKVVYKGLTKSRMQKVLATGKLPDGYDYAVLTYSQVNTGDEISRKEAAEAAKKSGKRGKKSKDDGRITPKAPFLRSISKGNYLFLDESHTAAGEGKTGSFMQSILRDVKAATFASATFAKRPDTMPLYAIRTSMSQAKVDPDKLISIIEKGGVTLQEIMSRELTNAGQMVRRERDMSDVVTDWETIDDPVTTRRARDNYDRTIAAFNAIIKFQEDYVKPMVEAMDKELAVMAESAGIKRGTNKMGVDNVPFASKTYNYTKQLMLALKADAIADKADSEIKSGRHPVIALESTMESSIDEYAAGEVVAEPTFGTNLLKGLDSVMQYTIKDENGKEQHARYSPRQLGEAGEKAYYELQDFIRESTSDVFISPIDAIIGRLHEMGYKVGELTGRDKYVELDNEGRAVVRKRTDKDKKRMQREFNNGELDVLILNKSASTGISLHASEKFKDQRQRTMIVAQPLSDINDYMQMIGRIDRTGQVHRGYYINLGLPVPAENRFLMMLSTKLKSLNANTTTSQDSESNEVEAPDLLNKYGSQVVVEYLRDNPDIYEKMGSPLKKGGDKGGTVSLSELDEYKPQEEDALKITGRVALLATQEQEEFYDDVVRRYNELIKYLNDTGNNDLKITVMPLRAKTLTRRVSSEGIDPTGDNPFAQNSYVERVEMDVLRKPMKASEVRKTIEQVNKGQRPEDYIRQVVSTIDKEDEARIAAEEARYERAKLKAQEDIAKQAEKINRQQKRTAEEKQAAIADYAKEANENVEAKHGDNMARLNTNSDMLKRRLRMFEVGKPYLVPDNLEVLTFDFSTPAIFCGYKAKDSKITASTTLAVFATLDGRRRVEIKLSQLGALQSIHRQTQDNYDVAQSTTLDNWDSQIPTGTRKTGFIMTGNILQAIADTQDERGGFPGQLISYTDIDGNVHDGILMPDKWNTSMLKTSGAPIISRLKQIKDYMPVTSHDGKVELTGSSWAKLYYLTVPKTKKDGAVYYENKTLLDAVHGHNFYPYRGKLRADITAENIERVVRELSKLGVRVKEETNEDDALYRLDDELGEVNERFNEELRRYDSGEMDTNEMFHLGMPQGVMRAFLPDLPIVMRQRVAKKGAEKKHNVPTSALQDMPSMISYPIFVFQRDANTIGILTDMTDNDGKNVCVAIELGRVIQNGGEYLEVNDIRSFHGREVKYIIEPIVHNNTLRYANKEKGLAWLSSASQPVQQEIDKQDLIDAANIVRNFENPSFNGDNLREGVGELSDDDLSIANDPVSKLLGKSTRTAAQRRAFAEKERQRMVNAVQDLAAKLHLDNVEVVTDASTLDGRRAKAKGFYSRSTGRITIVIPNQTSVFDAEQTLLHEAVAHYGLRELFGEHFDTFLDNVLANADEAVRRRILELSRRHGWDSRTATEEYLASLAEETNFEAANRTGWWQKIKELFLDMLHRIGFEDFSGVTLSDNELRYILWRSYENLREPGRYRSILGEAEDIARQAELKVGRYAEDGGAGAGVAAESGSDSKAERIRKLRESEPVEITGKEIEASDDLKQYKKNALEYGKSLRANYQNKDTGVTIQLGKTGVKEVLNHDYKNVEQLQSIAAIPQIIENSIYIDSQENADPEKNEDVSMYHYYVCGLKIGDSDYTVRAVIAEQPNGNRYYDHKLTQIEKGKLLDSLSGITTPGFNQETFPISEVKDTKLLSLLQTEEEEKVLYRMADSAEDYERALVRDKYEKLAGSLLFNSAESVFDNMQSLKEAMQMIVKAEGRGMHIEEIEGFENAYLGENRLSSVNEDEMRRVARELYKPLIDAVSRLAPDKAAREALMRYMKAKHGLERNVEMRVREKERVVAEKAGRRPHDPGEDASPRARAAYEKSLAEWEERVDGLSGELAAIDRRDFAGLTGLTGEVSVAGAEAAAARLVEDYERYHDVSEVWSRMRAATDFILDKSLDSGLLGRASYDRIKGMYGNYVPLRGFAETTVAERYNYLDQLQGGVGNVLKRAKGRTTEADDPLVELSLMLDSVVMQGNRNLLVKQRFLNFVMNHPSDLVSVSGLYIEHDEVTGRWRAVSPELDAGMSAAEVSSAMTAFVSRMDKLCEEQPERYKKVDDRVDVPYIVPDQRTLRQHQVIVKRGGRDVVLTVNGNPRLAQALNGLLNPDHNIGGVADRVLQAGETLNRHLAAFYTSRNPDFVLSNFIRDAFYSNAMTWVKEGGAYSRRFMSNMGQFNPASIVRLIYRYEHGQLDMGNEVERLFKLFMQHGGETGWTIMRDIDKHRKAVERELRNSRHMTVRQGWDVAMGYYDLFNRGVENCARFAAFLTSMQSGRSIDRSIWDAKEVSVNFNKRGSGIKAWDEGAGWGSASNWVRAMSGMGRAGYVFWNASVQGLSNFARAAKRNPGRVVPLAAVSFGLGLLAPVVNEMLVAAMGGDDEYYDLPEFYRRSNWVFALPGGGWLTLPLPIELRAFYGAGELASSLMGGKVRMSGGEITMELAATVSQVLPLNFLEGGGSWQALVPSAAAPVVEVVVNRDWTGIPVYRSTTFNEHVPEWRAVYKNTNELLVDASRRLSRWTGGNDVDRGRVEINPAGVQHVLEGYLGGFATFTNKLVGLASQVIDADEEVDVRNVPFVNRVYKEGNDKTRKSAVREDYFLLMEEYGRTEYRLREYRKRAARGVLEFAERLDWLNNSEEFARYVALRPHKSAIDKLRQMADMTDDEARVDSINALIDDEMAAAVDACVAIGE